MPVWRNAIAQKASEGSEAITGAELSCHAPGYLVCVARDLGILRVGEGSFHLGGGKIK